MRPSKLDIPVWGWFLLLKTFCIHKFTSGHFWVQKAFCAVYNLPHQWGDYRYLLPQLGQLRYLHSERFVG